MEKLIPFKFGRESSKSQKNPPISLDELSDLCEEKLDFDRRQTITEKLQVKRKPFVLIR